MAKRKAPRSRNPVAAALRSPHLAPKRVPSGKRKGTRAVKERQALSD